MRDCHNENHMRRLERKMFDIRSSEFDSSKHNSNKVPGGRIFGDEEMDPDYAWLLNFLTDTEQTKSSAVVVIGNEVEVEIEDEDEDGNDNDLQYSMFLKQLAENGKSYKLKISKNDEALKYLEYEEQDKSDGYDRPTYTNINVGNSGDKVTFSEDMGDRQTNQRVKRSPSGKKREISMAKEISRKKKIKDLMPVAGSNHDILVDSCYQSLLNGCMRTKYGEFVYEGERVTYEEKATSSDSDILIWDNGQDYSEVNNKQLLTAKKDPSLKEKLMRILRQPYNQKEYEELLQHVEQEKPICRLLPLRHRAISSALEGVKKSLLDISPSSFRKKLKAAQNERPRALNLLRMFRFWLLHMPHEDIFQPWNNDDCLKVLPRR